MLFKKLKMSDDLRYDEDKAIDFIRKTLPKDVDSRCSDNDILYVIDIIWEWYEANGYTSLDGDLSENETLDMAPLVAYVRKEVARDKDMNISPDDIEPIVKGELQYEDSLEDFI